MSERDLIRAWLLWKEGTGGRSISQKDLADRAGLSPTYLSSIMTGARNAGTKTIERIAEAMGLTLAGFYAGPPEDDPTVRAGKSRMPDSPSASEDSRVSSPVIISESSAIDPVREGASPGATGWRISSLRSDQVDRLFDSFGYAIPEEPLRASDVSPEPSAGPAVVPSPGADGGIPVLSEVPEGDWSAWPIVNGCRDYPMIPRCFVSGQAFGVRVDDDSMIPILERGSLLVADPGITVPLDGRPAIVAWKGRFLVRRISGSGERLILTPSNPSYSPEVVDTAETALFAIALIIPPGILLR